MNTVEMSYVMGITFLVILGLVNGTVRLHHTVAGNAKEILCEEANAHTAEMEKKLFKPESFARAATILESVADAADVEEGQDEGGEDG